MKKRLGERERTSVHSQHPHPTGGKGDATSVQGKALCLLGSCKVRETRFFPDLQGADCRMKCLTLRIRILDFSSPEVPYLIPPLFALSYSSVSQAIAEKKLLPNEWCFNSRHTAGCAEEGRSFYAATRIDNSIYTCPLIGTHIRTHSCDSISTPGIQGCCLL